MSEQPASRESAPLFALVGDHEAVLAVQEPLLAWSEELIGARERAEATGRRLVVLTPPTTVSTLAVQHRARHGEVRWLIDDGLVTRDALTGEAVVWTDGRMQPAGEMDSPSPMPTGGSELVLHLVLELLHVARRPPLGQVLAVVAQELGAEPAEVWGTAEPLTDAWEAAALVESARRRSPDPTTSLVRSPHFDAVLTVHPQPVGVLERVEMLIDVEEPHDADELTALGRALRVGGVQLGIGGYRLLNPGRLVPAPAGPVAPALLVADPARFALRPKAPHLPTAPTTPPQIRTFVTPSDLGPAAAQDLVDRWESDLRQLAATDMLRDLSERSAGVRRGSAAGLR